MRGRNGFQGVPGGPGEDLGLGECREWGVRKWVSQEAPGRFQRVSGSVEKYVEKWKVEGLKKLMITGIKYASYLED